ncbi:hypothetical protein RXV86_12995 [Alisedimentitalea sp. MJ-SS2]|uniref:hypothetical protein n=1 Tax=Aliisedimentitalea sp. MJ-SS2 TaxID=3049795 RepID=UPI0029105092|nr:hypothetical protein [Alisedimentitalea sp. MJ-SS2]MDU8928306.1 hypothetical protein [Alisedimentitalea sp. MJ-SS2]
MIDPGTSGQFRNGLVLERRIPTKKLMEIRGAFRLLAGGLFEHQSKEVFGVMLPPVRSAVGIPVGTVMMQISGAHLRIIQPNTTHQVFGVEDRSRRPI